MIFRILNYTFLGFLAVSCVIVFVNLDCSGEMGALCVLAVPICLFLIALPLGLILVIARLMYFILRQKIKKNLKEFYFLIFFLILFLCFCLIVFYYLGDIVFSNYLEFIGKCWIGL